MNKIQQELYEKLLKKVNEYCLGYAAEDVIAAIDALVDTYESRSSTNMDLDDALKVIYDSQDIMGGHDDFWKAYRTIEKALKALEIIKNKEVDVGLLLACESEPEYLNRCCNRYWTNDKCGWKRLSQEEYKFLKEVLK